MHWQQNFPTTRSYFEMAASAPKAYAEAVSVYLAFGVSRLSDIQNSLCRWEASKTQVRNLFGRQAIPMIWDFGENNVFNRNAGDYRTSLGSIVKVIERFCPRTEGFEIKVTTHRQCHFPRERRFPQTRPTTTM